MKQASKPPTGAVAFLFTDIVGSTEMWETHGDGFLPLLQAHNAILTDALQRNGGYLIKTEGDAFKIAFDDPAAAVRCAIVAQAALQRYPWPADAPAVTVRMAVHTGTPFLQSGDYFGPPVNRTARILSAVHGGQISVSEDALNLVEHRSGADTRFSDLGYHRLKDLDDPVRLYQVQHPALAARQFPPPRSLNAHANNLPVQRTSFIGREKDIEQVAALLSRSGPGVLTLTGPAGIGKTRLSLQAAAERVDWFPDGVWYVALSDVRSQGEAAEEIAHTVGLEIGPDSDPIETVRAWVAERQCLLILDDCRNPAEAGRLIRELLDEAPGLRCLATARDSLRLDEGAEFAVAEMAVPPVNASADDVMATDAGRLFVERAHQARPDFRLTDARAKPVSRLLQKLGGMPASLERAAEMMRNKDVTPSRLLAQLGQGAEEVTSAATALGREALQRMSESPSVTGMVHAVGKAVVDHLDLAAAEMAIRDQLQERRSIGDEAGAAECVRKLGKIAYARRDYQRAVTLLASAESVYDTHGLPDLQAVRTELREAQQSLGPHRSAAALPLNLAVSFAIEGEN